MHLSASKNLILHLCSYLRMEYMHKSLKMLLDSISGVKLVFQNFLGGMPYSYSVGMLCISCIRACFTHIMGLNFSQPMVSLQDHDLVVKAL